jgi:hypothetical protein
MSTKYETVEINGTKFEVDLSTAKKVEEFRVGDKVKVLQKGYGDNYEINPGVIIGFEWFQELPTITIAYLKISYNDVEIKFLYYNQSSKDVEISHTDNLELLIKPKDIMEKIDKKIEQAKLEIEDLELKKQYFLKNFGEYFKAFTPEELKELL